MLDFIEDFDRLLAESGPPAVFTINQEGVLQLDPMRTRDFRKQNGPPFHHEACHCLLVDHATGWPQYALITSSGLCSHPRAHVFRFSNEAAALSALADRKEQFYRRRIK